MKKIISRENEIQEISKDHANEIMCGQVSDSILDSVINKYHKEDAGYVPGWKRRVATTDFILYGF